MVFHFRCFSLPYVHDILGTRATASVDDFHTANSHFDETRTDPTVIPDLKVSPTLRVFTFSDLKKATRNFRPSSVIGEGGFSTVFKGRVNSKNDQSTDIDVAVKRFTTKKGYKTWVTEVNVLGEINHENLVKLIGFCDENDHFLLVYEYMPKLSLDFHLRSRSRAPLPWGIRLKIAKDAATGLEHLHKEEIIFRDFKPSNILLDKEWNAKLSDFGFARYGPDLEDGESHVSTEVVGTKGTKGYAAPEYVKTGHLTSKSDVWSYVIFLEELITGRRPTAQNKPEKNSQCLRLVCCYAGTEKSELTVDSRLKGMYSNRSMKKVNLIAKRCLVKDPKMRPTMSKVLAMVQEAIALENQQVG